jgi:hypothetical protein
VFVRYDPAAPDEAHVRAGSVKGSLADIAPKLSECMIHVGAPPKQFVPDDNSPGVSMFLVDATGATKQSRLVRYCFSVNPQLPEGFQLPKPPARPVCIASIQNEVVIQAEGCIVPADGPLRTDGPDVEQFIAQSRARLPVGWLAIEIYPLLGEEYWRPEHAAAWADMDILGIAARRNLQENQLNAIDSREAARKRYAAILAEFERLLDGPEEPVHQFLCRHPEIISQIHDRVWSKLCFGATKSDFVFREPYNDYEIVEIEAPTRPLFRKNGQQREELTHAINQTSDWVRYIEDNKRTVEDELGLTGISTNPRRLVVIGRSKSLTEENRRKLTTLQNEQPKLRILTYDDLLAGARANIERLFGPLSLVVTGENARVFYFKK